MFKKTLSSVLAAIVSISVFSPAAQATDRSELILKYDQEVQALNSLSLSLENAEETAKGLRVQISGDVILILNTMGLVGVTGLAAKTFFHTSRTVSMGSGVIAILGVGFLVAATDHVTKSASFFVQNKETIAVLNDRIDFRKNEIEMIRTQLGLSQNLK